MRAPSAGGGWQTNTSSPAGSATRPTATFTRRATSRPCAQGRWGGGGGLLPRPFRNRRTEAPSVAETSSCLQGLTPAVALRQMFNTYSHSFVSYGIVPAGVHSKDSWRGRRQRGAGQGPKVVEGEARHPADQPCEAAEAVALGAQRLREREEAFSWGPLREKVRRGDGHPRSRKAG